jgi:hypothetical protein
MLSAAKFVDNKIKEQAQAYLAQQSGAAPPKVNEQVIESMGAQPENSGIAQLPAPNMQGMAGGGIVAFARGDVVKGADGMDYYEGEGGKMLEAGSTEATIDAAKVGVPKAFNALKAGLGQIDLAGYEAGNVGSALAGAKVPVAAPTGPSMNPGKTLPPTGMGAGRGTGGAPAPAPAEKAARAAGSAQPAMPTMKTTSDSDILATYNRIQKDINPNVTVDPYAEQTEANRADAASVGQRQLSDATAREQGLAALLSKREGRIQEREGRIQGTEDLNTKMSIINAGLAMMQSTGKGLAGIAEGATVGAKQYGEGKKATELARQKIEDARDAYDELRFNQEGMTAKEKTAAVATITSASISARNTAVKNMQDKQGLTAKQATDLFDNTIRAQLEKQRAENQLKLEAMQQGGANARTDKQIASQTTKFNPMTSYADYLKGFAGKETITPPMSYADYVAQFQGPKMVTIPDANLRP